MKTSKQWNYIIDIANENAKKNPLEGLALSVYKLMLALRDITEKVEELERRINELEKKQNNAV